MTVKKVLFLHHGIFYNRGSEKVLLCLLDNLDRERFEPLLVCNHKLFAADAEKQGVKTLQLDWPEVMIEKGHVKLQFFAVLKTILWLKRLIKKESIELLVCNSGLTTQTGYYAAKLSGVSCLSYIHSPFTKRYIYLYGLHKTNLAVFVSKAIKTAMNKKVTFGDAMVIHNGIDIERFKPVAIRNRNLVGKVKVDDNVPIIGQIGSLIHRKGIDLLIEAAKLLRQKSIEFHIVLAGCGSEENEYKERVTQLNLDDVITFAGDVDAPDMYYKHLFDINVLASRSEAFGLTLAEGAACGLPCVGSNTEGIPEVICDKKTGLFFESGNAKDLADKLELLIRDPSLRESMGQMGREFVVENLSQAKQVESFNNALLRLEGSDELFKGA